MKRILIAALVLGPTAAAAQSPPIHPAAAASAHAIVAQPEEIAWQPAPPSLPAGAKVVLLEGDPSQPGPFTMRIWMPDGYRIPAHSHPGQERVTVVSGTFLVGMGEVFDAANLTALAPGAYASMPPQMVHHAQARGETVIQLNNVGPWSLTYANPADDPRTQRR